MRIWKYFLVSIGVILCLLLIAVELNERLTLPNGLYIYKTPFIPTRFAERNFYIYNEDDELIIDEPVEFLCFNDDYLEGISYASRFSRSSFVYEIATKKRFDSPHPEYYEVARKSGLSGHGTSCDGHLKYNIGTSLLWMKPSRLTGDLRLPILRNQ